MFRRRSPDSFFKKFKNMIYPDMGMKRLSRYYLHRIAKIRASEYSIAAGFACGAAISFTPFIGFHFIISAAFAFIIRANVIAALIGTAVGNPWTFPFIWSGTYKLGHMILGTYDSSEEASFMEIFDSLKISVETLDISSFINNAWPVLKFMMVGSLIPASIAWFLFYFIIKKVLIHYRKRKHKTRAKI